MYINRHQEQVLKSIFGQFPAVLLTGARQVGKSTLLQNLFKDFSYLSLDNPLLLQQAKEEPFLFLNNQKLPLILDEIQYAPELFSLLKLKIDELKSNSLFLLSGSQAFELMQNVSESLAGRIAIIKLSGLSLREIINDNFNKPFIPNLDYLNYREIKKDNLDIWKIIHQGFMPRLYEQITDWNIYYSSYLATYIERDIRQISNINNLQDFSKFMVALAGRSAELLNYSSLALDVGISVDTAKRWTAILEAAGIIYLLYPYSNNHLKRAIKTPKVYFMDTGLLAFLTKWLTAETIKNGAKAGQFFETFIISEIIKSFYNVGQQPPIYFYRDTNQKEIDLIIEYGQDIYPIEIKTTANPNKKMGSSFNILKKIDKNINTGIIICQYPEKIILDKELIAIPYNYI